MTSVWFSSDWSLMNKTAKLIEENVGEWFCHLGAEKDYFKQNFECRNHEGNHWWLWSHQREGIFHGSSVMTKKWGARERLNIWVNLSEYWL